MTQIKIDKNEFNIVANKFLLAAEKCTNIQKKLKDASDDLITTWKGNSKEAFSNEYTKLYQNMFNYFDILNCISKDLTSIASSFEEVDASLKSQMNTLSNI